MLFLIDDGTEFRILGDGYGNNIRLPSVMSAVNVFESIGYEYIKSENRPAESTPLTGIRLNNMIRAIIMGWEINYETYVPVYTLRKRDKD